jgi:predicted kinase
MGVGKTTISRAIEKISGARLISTDAFATQQELGRNGPYVDALDVAGLRSRAIKPLKPQL